MLKKANSVIVFVIELIMIGSFAYFGFQSGKTAFIKYALAVTIPLTAIMMWAYWAAPKSSRRFRMPYLALFRLTMFLMASYLLYKCNRINLAVIVAFFAVTTQLVSYVLNE